MEIPSGADVIRLLEDICALEYAQKILSTFLTPFDTKAIPRFGGEVLVGNFNIAGTKTGRMSSQKPNFQNLPSSGSPYAGLIKEIFRAPLGTGTETRPDWLFVGADYTSLEAMVKALVSKDPNMLKVYTDGFDSHCLNTAAYYRDQMPDIDPESVTSVNSIKTKYPHLRKASKTCTFAIQYGATPNGLVQNTDLTPDKAEQVHAAYHRLYRVSTQWTADKVAEAAERGYAELAFGLRLKCPVLQRSFLNGKHTPREAHKSWKTVGNALIQSYGLLNTRACSVFMQQVWDSEYATSVFPAAQIHDSIYLLIRNSYACLEWVNRHLIQCMTETVLPELDHPKVKLQAQLEVYWPSWAHPIPIPNNATKEDLHAIFQPTEHTAASGGMAGE